MLQLSGIHLLANDMKELIVAFNDSLQQHLPALEQEVNSLIESKSRDENNIEYTLDVILSLTMHGVGNALYIKLLNYYKTVNSEGANFYWQDYDKLEE
jgi:hypothetical protein